MADYVSRVEYIRSQLEDVGLSVAETTAVAKIISGLPPFYRGFVTQWGASTSSQQRIATLLGRLLEEEALQVSYKRPPKENVACNADSPNKRGDKQGKNKGANNNNTNKKKGKKKDKDNKCYNCGKGHFANKCPDKIDSPQPSTSKEDKSKNAKPAAAVIAESNLSYSSRAGWIVDTGATEHMSNDRSSFANFVELNPRRPVRVGDSSIIYGIGVGDVRVLSILSDGSWRELVLKNVLYVPKIWRKLFSVGATTEQGNCGSVAHDKLVIKNSNGEELIVAERDGQLFKANIRELCSEAEVAAGDELGVWHERYGHVHKQRLVKMARLKAVEGLDSIAKASTQSETARCVIDCESCLVGKQPRLHFGESSRPKATKVGDRVHADICGPIAPYTVGGNNYFVLFKDEHSSYRHVFFIKSKSEAYDALRKCVAAYRGEQHTPMKLLVTDQGSEFTSNRTQEFLLEHAIHHSRSAPFTPAQNGLIERDNRTVVESARSMLAARQLPHSLWGEAVQTAVYLLNRCINNRNDVTPYELVFGRKPKAAHLRVFGAKACER